VRARPGTSSTQPRYSHEPIAWPGIGVPVHKAARAELLVDPEVEELGLTVVYPVDVEDPLTETTVTDVEQPVAHWELWVEEVTLDIVEIDELTELLCVLDEDEVPRRDVEVSEDVPEVVTLLVEDKELVKIVLSEDEGSESDKVLLERVLDADWDDEDIDVLLKTVLVEEREADVLLLEEDDGEEVDEALLVKVLVEDKELVILLVDEDLDSEESDEVLVEVVPVDERVLIDEDFDSEESDELLVDAVLVDDRVLVEEVVLEDAELVEMLLLMVEEIKVDTEETCEGLSLYRSSKALPPQNSSEFPLQTLPVD
jgi:hypothetical protein